MRSLRMENVNLIFTKAFVCFFLPPLRLSMLLVAVCFGCLSVCGFRSPGLDPMHDFISQFILLYDNRQNCAFMTAMVE